MRKISLLVILLLCSLCSFAQQQQTVTVITPAQIYALGTNPAVGPQVIPPPGSGNTIVVDSVYVNLQYAGTPYALGTGSMVLSFFGGDTVASNIFSASDIKQSQSVLRFTQPAGGAYYFLNPWDTNVPVFLSLTTNTHFAAGNSNIVVTINYHIIPVA